MSVDAISPGRVPAFEGVEAQAKDEWIAQQREKAREKGGAAPKERGPRSDMPKDTRIPVIESVRPGGAPAPLISVHDIGILCGLPFLALTAWLTPEAAWRPLARAIAPYCAAVLSRGRKPIAECVAGVAGDRPLALSPEAVARELVAAEIQRNLQYTRDLLPGRWRPEIVLFGEAHVRDALARGKGVILWCGHFVFAAMVVKMAMHRAGIALHHLSHPHHGFSETRFGMGVLNPLRAASDKHYLSDLVVLSLTGAVAAMRILLKRLRENGVVSIVVRDIGLYPLETPIMDGTIQIATGAPDLAYTTGAALIPVFAVQEDDGRYTVTAQAPIEMAEATRRDAAAAAVEAYTDRLEPYVLNYPGQWWGWTTL